MSTINWTKNADGSLTASIKEGITATIRQRLIDAKWKGYILIDGQELPFREQAQYTGMQTAKEWIKRQVLTNQI